MARCLGIGALVVLVVMVVVAAGEKLEGGLEVITRRELSDEEGFVPEARAEFGGGGGGGGGGGFPDTPAASLALSYLPPAQDPLPIESSIGDAGSHTQPDTFVPPEPVPSQNPPGDQYTPINPQFDPSSQQFDQFDPSTDEGDVDSLPPVVPGVIPIPEVEEEEPEFFTKVGESKLALLGGVMGAKTAVLDGLRDAKESLVTGIKGAVTAKSQAFSALTKSSQVGGQHKGFAGSVPAGAVVPYPIYPPYPKPHPQPAYPQPVYHTTPAVYQPKGGYYQPKGAYYQPKGAYYQPKGGYYQPKASYPIVVYPAQYYQPKPALAKFKAPFQYLHPSYSYYYAPRHY